MRFGRKTDGPTPAASALASGGTIGPTSIDGMVTAFMDSYSPNGSSGLMAERIGAVNRCLQLTSQQIATMPLKYNGKSPQPGWVSNPEPELYSGINEAIFAAVWSRYARGEAFLYVTSRYASGFPATWLVLDAITMEVTRDAYGLPQYVSNSIPLNAKDVLHIKRDAKAGQLRGTPALEAYWSNLASAWSSESFAADTFNHSGVPSAVLKWNGKLTAEQAATLQAQWVAAVSSRSGAPAVIDSNLDYGILAFSPKDLMLLELREFDTKQIASAFGVPAFLLNLPQAGGLNYSNPSQLFDIWWRSELLTCAHSFAVALSTWLPMGNWLDFDPSIVLRPDFPTLVTGWLAMLDHSVVTADEVRAHVLNLPPLSEGEAIGLINQPTIGGAIEGLSAAAAPLQAVTG